MCIIHIMNLLSERVLALFSQQRFIFAFLTISGIWLTRVSTVPYVLMFPVQIQDKGKKKVVPGHSCNTQHEMNPAEWPSHQEQPAHTKLPVINA